MQYSVVNYNKVRSDSESFRIDAEYYQPIYLENDHKVKSYVKVERFGKLIKDLINGDEIRDYYNEGLPYLRVSDIKEFFLDLSDVVFIPKDSQIKENIELKPGNLLVSRSGSLAITAIVNDELAGSVISSHLIKVDLNPSINPHYLVAFLNCKFGKNQIFKRSNGAVVPEINHLSLKELFIPIASDLFQNKMEELIKEAGQKIKESISFYTQAEQVLLCELGLLDWKPKHKLSFIRDYSEAQSAERIDAEFFPPMYEEIVKAIKSATSYKPLGDIVLIKKCIEPGSEEYQESGIPFLRVSNLSKFGLNNDNQQYLSEALYNTLSEHQPKKGEILLSKDATPGIAYYLKDEPKKMIPSSGVLRVTIKDAKAVLPEYLTLVLNSVIVQKQIERDAGGSIINHWRPDQIKNTLIPVLSNKKQEEIANKISESFSNREQSKHLLDIAKRGVEMAIEKDETQAQNWINSETKKLNITFKKS